MCRLVAMDLDKTLVGRDGSVPDKVLSRLRELRSEGVHIALCTGRVTKSAEHYAELVGGASVVSFNGSSIRTETGKVLKSEVPLDTVRKVVDYCYDKGIYVQLYRDQTILVDHYTKELETDLDINFTEYEELGDLRKAELCQTPKLIALDLSENLSGYRDDIVRMFPDLTALESSAYVLEIMPKGIDKGYGLKTVADSLGIPQSETAAIGDSMNDYPMVVWAGTGVAVGNADPRLKEAADMVTEREMSYGVLDALNALFS